MKDLGLLGRNLDSVVIIDNSAVSFQFQPNNGIECVPFIDDMQDRELIEMIPFLEYLSKKSVGGGEKEVRRRMFDSTLPCGMPRGRRS